ncbi:MAG: hypothetical protein ACI9I0_002056, partial [Rhodoferax sp.]
PQSIKSFGHGLGVVALARRESKAQRVSQGIARSRQAVPVGAIHSRALKNARCVLQDDPSKTTAKGSYVPPAHQ